MYSLVESRSAFLVPVNRLSCSWARACALPVAVPDSLMIRVRCTGCPRRSRYGLKLMFAEPVAMDSPSPSASSTTRVVKSSTSWVSCMSPGRPVSDRSRPSAPLRTITHVGVTRYSWAWVPASRVPSPLTRYSAPNTSQM
nr:hypothetical protein [Actinomycetales bacterium]